MPMRLLIGISSKTWEVAEVEAAEEHRPWCVEGHPWEEEGWAAINLDILHQCLVAEGAEEEEAHLGVMELWLEVEQLSHGVQKILLHNMEQMI